MDIIISKKKLIKLLEQTWEQSSDYTDQVSRINSGLSNFDKPTEMNKTEFINSKIKKLC